MNKQPGTITEGDFNRKLAAIDAQFGGLNPSQKQIADANAYITSSNVQQKISQLQQQEIEMGKRRATLEHMLATTLDLRKTAPDQEGSTALLYCQFASQLAIATYEEQQDHYYIQIGLRFIRYAEQLK